MIYRITDGDIPMVGTTVLSLGDGDSWAPVTPADPHDLAAVDVPTYEDRGIHCADLPWADSAVLGPYAPEGAPTAADWQRILEDVDGTSIMVACLPACWLGEVSSETDGWVAVVRETPQSRAEAALSLALGCPVASLCVDCLTGGVIRGRTGGYPASASSCSRCGAAAAAICEVP